MDSVNMMLGVTSDPTRPCFERPWFARASVWWRWKKPKGRGTHTPSLQVQCTFPMNPIAAKPQAKREAGETDRTEQSTAWL